LRYGVARAVVHVEDVLGLVQLQAQALGAQRESQARPVARGVDALLPGALGGEQSHVLVEADRPRGEVEFPGELADGEGLRGHAWWLGRRRRQQFWPVLPTMM